MASFTNRLIRAAKLDVSLYEEVEADTGAMGQAMAVVIFSSVAAGVGSIAGGKPGAILVGLIGGIIAALIGWFIWAYLTYLIGTKLLPGQQTESTFGELLRTLGFSSSPGLIRVLGVIPVVGIVVAPVAGIWMLIAMVIAIRQALDYESTWRAIGVCVIGWIIYMLIALLFGLVIATTSLIRF